MEFRTTRPGITSQLGIYCGHLLLLVLVLQCFRHTSAAKSLKCDLIFGSRDYPKVNANVRPMTKSGNNDVIEDESKNGTVADDKGKRDAEISENLENVPIPLNETRSSFLEVPENGGANNESPVGPLELVCSASYPVQWNFHRFQVSNFFIYEE